MNHGVKVVMEHLQGAVVGIRSYGKDSSILASFSNLSVIRLYSVCYICTKASKSHAVQKHQPQTRTQASERSKEFGPGVECPTSLVESFGLSVARLVGGEFDLPNSNFRTVRWGWVVVADVYAYGRGVAVEWVHLLGRTLGVWGFGSGSLEHQVPLSRVRDHLLPQEDGNCATR